MRNQRGSKLLSHSVMGALAALSIAIATLTAPAPAHAAGAVDLRAELTVPAAAPSGTAFEYTATIGNSGLDPADGATFTLTFASGTTGISAVCAGVTAGAVCDPASFVVSPGSSSVPPSLSGAIPTLPGHAGGEEPTITITVTGTFPNSTSATAELVVTGPEGTTEADPTSNTAAQSTALENTYELAMLATQDQEEVASGETRTYRITYSNNGPATALKVWPGAALSLGTEQTTLFTLGCEQTGGASCPTWADGATTYTETGAYLYPFQAVTGLYQPSVPIASGQSLTFVLTTTTTLNHCASGGVRYATLTAHISDASTGTNTGDAASQVLQGRITTEPCPAAELRVSQTQDIETVPSGSPRVYTITYSNGGPSPAQNMLIEDRIRVAAAHSTEFEISCESNIQGGCPEWAQNTVSSSAASSEPFTLAAAPAEPTISLEAGQVTTFTIRATTTLDACAVGGAVAVSSTATFTTPAGVENTGPSYNLANRSGTITSPPCPQTELTIEVSQSTESAPTGATRSYTTTFTNAGPTDVEDMVIHDGIGPQTRHTRVATASCESTIPEQCPDWATGTKAGISTSLVSLFAMATESCRV